jgi:uncharacterized damage-inducible protein DinB
MTTLIEAIDADIDREAAATRKVLAQFPEGKDDWKPHEKSMPLGYLAFLCASLPSWVALVINTEKKEFNSKKEAPKADAPPKPAMTRESLLKTLDESVAAAHQALRATNDDVLHRDWSFVLDGVPVTVVPRHIAIRDLGYHGAHHRGQLTVYLRLNGAKVPAIYGPSADEGVGRP